ncbi:unnamed protein product [Vitrella brassicaformis CCMP3155]|uniref:Uncharacterized protein n=1 Tax=Vitrella brassicaformis (strain CCMP3155) TaxID=1169540 RepID=A0A0G4FKB4_VITBC|nr:unnamed protein product [Vitrella brassicaformis CCMP3155]|eukprot:CEM14251.1 unnamed protein product [Vitrella brassicaformis CCMP3155]
MHVPPQWLLRVLCTTRDGTAVDSVTSIIRCWVRAVKEGKKTACDNKRRRQAADGSGDCDDDMTLIRRWTRGVDPFDGSRNFLDALRRRGVRLAVATGKSRRGLNVQLDSTGFRPLFAASRPANTQGVNMSSSALREVEAIGCLSGWLGQVIPPGVCAFIGKSFLRECVPLEFGWTAALLGHHSIPGAVTKCVGIPSPQMHCR